MPRRLDSPKAMATTNLSRVKYPECSGITRVRSRSGSGSTISRRATFPRLLDIAAWATLLYTDTMSTNSNQYNYLVRKPKSAYKQLFIKDRWVSARTLYGMYVNE